MRQVDVGCLFDALVSRRCSFWDESLHHAGVPPSVAGGSHADILPG